MNDMHQRGERILQEGERRERGAEGRRISVRVIGCANFMGWLVEGGCAVAVTDESNRSGSIHHRINMRNVK